MATEQGTQTSGFDDEQLPILGHGSENGSLLGQTERSIVEIPYSTHDNHTGTLPLEEDVPYPHSFSTAKEAENYNMSHPQRGKAVIFNCNTFKDDTAERKGSEKDLEDLVNCLTGMEFTVEKHNNPTHDDYRDVIRRRTLVSVHEIWTDFHADQCPTLAGKPKIFIIQACRGDILDDGTPLKNISHYTRSSQTDFSSFSYTIPNAADIFVAFSSPVGHSSWRCPENGSWFIQAICEVFNQFKFTLDLQQMFLKVNRKVALYHQSKVPDDSSRDKKVQVPCICHTLIRNVKFEPKSVQESAPAQDDLRTDEVN